MNNGKSKKNRNWLAYAAMAIGGILAGILLIPTGFLVGLIYGIYVVTDRFVRWCDREEACSKVSGTVTGDSSACP